MGLFSLIAVLLIEQIRPLPYLRVVHQPLSQLAAFIERQFNAGEKNNGLIAWIFITGALVLIAGAVHVALYALNPLLAWGWNVLLLYLTMGFRQFSHYYTDIQFALRMDDLPHARKLLAEWRGRSDGELSSSEIARLAIEEALASSHRHVFGVICCFVLLPGPCGAVLYRAAAFLYDQWGKRMDSDPGGFGKIARQAFELIDWLPLRVTAAGFAVVGNFENAIYCWRTQAGLWVQSSFGPTIGVVIASGAGALGVRLGEISEVVDEFAERAEINNGEPADIYFMQSAVGLVWRALMLCLLLLLLLGLAGLVAA